MDEQMEADGDEVIDLRERGMHKLEKCGHGNTECLLLDKNEMTRLENVESYGDLQKLSAAENKLVRMYGVCRLTHLRKLNLANNCIVAIEGLRELVHLQWLKLAGNKIKSIEHLNSNVELEYLDLSKNCILSLVNLSHLKVLNTLLLECNNLKNLTGAFPASLMVLNVSSNFISDLNQISFLGNLKKLEHLSIANNPCINMTGGAIGFDHRPFIINWCLNLKLLDGFLIGPKESLKAEWLYSMGKGRHFQVDEHAELVEYLSSVCPLTTAESLMTEEDAKLNRILNKQRQHQQQLQKEMSTSEHSSNRPCTAPLMTSSYHESSNSQLTSPPAFQRSKSTVPLRLKGTFSASTSSLHAAHNKPVSPTQYMTAAFKTRRKSDVVLEKYPGDMTCTRYESDLCQADFHDNIVNYSLNQFVSNLQTLPSDVPDSSHGFDDLDAPPLNVLLRAETQYVPVPETMLSPDFRPVSASPQQNMFGVASGFDSGRDLPPTSIPDVRPKWAQRSSIPRSTSGRPARPSATDSPILKRPTQVQRLQKVNRPSSLSPSCGRRSPPRQKATAARACDDDSSSSDTDSDVSLSKLLLVKEVAQTKLGAILRKSMESSMEEQSSRSEAPLQRETAVAAREEIVAALEILAPEVEEQNLKEKEEKEDEAATRIQAAWRGFRTRNHNGVVIELRQEMRVRRAEDHVLMLQEQLAKTQVELEGEKRLRMLQMEAIRALWKEVQQLQWTHSKDGSEGICPSADNGMDGTTSCQGNTSNVQHESNVEGEKGEQAKDVQMSQCPDDGGAAACRQKAVPSNGDDANCDELAACQPIVQTQSVMLGNGLGGGTTAKLVSHLLDTCGSLQTQVQQLQEALCTISHAVLEPASSQLSNGICDNNSDKEMAKCKNQFAPLLTNGISGDDADSGEERCSAAANGGGAQMADQQQTPSRDSRE